MHLSNEEMWKAVVSNDSSYDGVFYYAVKTTNIICKPSCNSKIPKRENVEFYYNLAEALCNGYRLCKRCRPDLGSSFSPESELIDFVKSILNTEYKKQSIIANLPNRTGTSQSHLERLFKKNMNLTLKQYVIKLRIGKACELLRQTELDNTTICFEVGFQSLSNFYNEFGKIVGMSPKKYKLLSKE